MAASPASAQDIEHLRVANSSTSIAVDQVFGDVVAVDGALTVDGVVRGHIFSVDTQVTLAERAVVLGSITAYRGALRVHRGAVLPETTTLHGTDFSSEEGPSPELEAPVRVGRGEVVAVSPASNVSIELMKRILPFARFVPGPTTTVEDLNGWHPDPDLPLRRVIEKPNALTVGGIARLTFVSNKVLGALQRGYRGAPGTVLVTAVQLQDPASATALWTELEAADQRGALRLSVKSALGDGAHWFFKRRDRLCMLWQRGHWVLAVETRVAKPKADLFHQLQFSERVLRSLEQKLIEQSAVSRGAQP
ncbi:MAG: polymer-forming cytoskeletal protein [Myxococcota bacterium]